MERVGKQRKGKEERRGKRRNGKESKGVRRRGEERREGSKQGSKIENSGKSTKWCKRLDGCGGSELQGRGRK